jgi:colanic acid biosynthesis glycosyl transferase WcaI
LEQGHDVRVITGFPMAPQWKVWDGYRRRLVMREVINDVPVLRTYLYVPRKPSRAIKRILFDTSFAVSSLIGGLFISRVDAILVVSPPLQLGVTGWLLGLRHRTRVMLHLQDLVPDAAITVGIMNPRGRAVRLAWALERFVYRRVDRISVICDGFRRNLLGKNVAPGKIRLLPNYIDPALIWPSERVNGFRHRFGIGPEAFVAMYSGSIAMKQGLQTFVEAAANLADLSEVSCYLIGEGPYTSELLAQARALALRNFTFLPLQPLDTLAEQLASADALVITQKRSVTDVVFPGKLLYYMAAGRPIVAAVAAESETGKFITEMKVGLVVPPEDSRALADALRYLKRNPDQAAALGRNGRHVVETQFDCAVTLPRFAAELRELAAR